MGITNPLISRIKSLSLRYILEKGLTARLGITRDLDRLFQALRPREEGATYFDFSVHKLNLSLEKELVCTYYITRLASKSKPKLIVSRSHTFSLM